MLQSYAGVPVLVLGASGFIGRWVARQLTIAGAELFLTVRDRGAARRTFLEYGVSGEILDADLMQFPVVDRMIRSLRPAIIFNLSGYGIDRSETSEIAAFKINGELPGVLCEAMAATKRAGWAGQRLIHAGTAMEYGIASGDLSEDTEARPMTLYGRSKLAGTESVRRICSENRIKGLTARLFAVYGPGESPTRLLPTLVDSKRDRRDIRLTSGTHKRDFTYLEDVAEGLLRLGLSDATAGEAVNVATGKLTSIRDFVVEASRQLDIEDSRLKFGALPTRPEEMDHLPVNIARLQQLTQWHPSTTISAGIRRTITFADRRRPVYAGVRPLNTSCELF